VEADMKAGSDRHAGTAQGANKMYLISVSALTFGFPIAACAVEMLIKKGLPFSFGLISKWFIFSAVGLRLFFAGVKQVSNPAFTAKEIFRIESPDSFPILRELGFANCCFGLIGIFSLFLPQWRIVSAFGSGLYFGIAGVQHLIRKPAGTNERFALVTDLFIFCFLLGSFAAYLAGI
jgi:hypothetical protein